MTAQELLDQSLALVESKNIRASANSEHNRPIWLQIAENAVQKDGESSNVHRFAAYIVCVMMGM